MRSSKHCSRSQRYATLLRHRDLNPPSFTLRGPSQTERDGGQGHAFPTVRKGTGQDMGVPDIARGDSTGAGRT